MGELYGDPGQVSRSWEAAVDADLKVGGGAEGKLAGGSGLASSAAPGGGQLHSRHAVPFQAEAEALLSEDDPIDRRPWTQQHLEAADIRRTPSLALTPPQAEQEVDVLDVNVRGPGQHPASPHEATPAWVLCCPSRVCPAW